MTEWHGRVEVDCKWWWGFVLSDLIVLVCVVAGFMLFELCMEWNVLYAFFLLWCGGHLELQSLPPRRLSALFYTRLKEGTKGFQKSHRPLSNSAPIKSYGLIRELLRPLPGPSTGQLGHPIP